MKIYNQSKTEILENPDLEKGYLKQDQIKTTYHEATPEIQEKSHYVTIKEYPNGGKDVEKVIDVEYQPSKEAYYDYEDIQVYIPYTEKEIAQIEISELKQKLFDTDYQAIKFAEGLLTSDEYAGLKAQRQSWRDEINKLEQEQVKNGL